jgi:hypothetical protein
MKKLCGEIFFIWPLLAGLAVQKLWVQAETRVTISGQVKDASTGKPLPSANVFLANTTLGAATDEEGMYAIKQAPLGTHDVVASLIGYEAQKRTLRISQARDAQLDFNLKPMPLQVAEIEVVAELPREWKKHLQKFEKLFWGNAYKASECRILNPEILDFAVDKEADCFTATASQPLQIENRKLGYRAQFLVEDFRYFESATKISYAFIPKFEELIPAGAVEAEKWEANRLQAYEGSFRHFLTALIFDRLDEEGFLVYDLAVPPWEDKQVRRLGIKYDELLAPGALPSERELYIKGCLEVTYHHSDGETQTSWIVPDKLSVTVNVAGYAYDGYALTLYGHWFQQRVAEMLPRDYQP